MTVIFGPSDAEGASGAGTGAEGGVEAAGTGGAAGTFAGAATGAGPETRTAGPPAPGMRTAGIATFGVAPPATEAGADVSAGVEAEEIAGTEIEILGTAGAAGAVGGGGGGADGAAGIDGTETRTAATEAGPEANGGGLADPPSCCWISVLVASVLSLPHDGQ